MTTDTVLTIQGLSKSFGKLKAVDQLDFSVNKGEIFGFLGPNGAGKTTTIHMLCGVIKPDSGTMMLDGEMMNERSGGCRVKLGLCPQETVLWELLTCEEQLVFSAELYGLKTREARLRAGGLLEQMGLEEKRKTLAKNLSGGMKRRLNIAMALVHDPDIVILDEPEAGLDPQSRVMVREFIRSLAPAKTVVFTSHNMDEVERICDRVAIIDHGKMLVLDTPGNLKRWAGEGDIIELTIKNEKEIREKVNEDLIKRLSVALATQLNEKLKEFTMMDGRIILRVLDGAHQLPIILGILGANEVTYSDIAFRWNTLEDVFIKLTGRSLRQ